MTHDSLWRSNRKILMIKKVLTYDVGEVAPYINWLYFYHAWGMSGKPAVEKRQLRDEASAMIQSWEGHCRTRAIFSLFAANADMDDLLLYLDDAPQGSYVRIPMLRQQHVVAEGNPNLCLADFVRPLSGGVRDAVGLFCASVDGGVLEAYRGDDYQSMMAQVLSDRLAEATVEKMHEEVRRRLWGYAPDERLSMEQLHREEYQGIRPAVGYPSLPDVSVNFELDRLLGMSRIGIRLTESGMMMPHSSVSGLMFAHPRARYFDLGKIDEEQLCDYARRRGIRVELMRRYLQSSLIKK